MVAVGSRRWGRAGGVAVGVGVGRGVAMDGRTVAWWWWWVGVVRSVR